MISAYSWHLQSIIFCNIQRKLIHLVVLSSLSFRIWKNQSTMKICTYHKQLIDCYECNKSKPILFFHRILPINLLKSQYDSQHSPIISVSLWSKIFCEGLSSNNSEWAYELRLMDHKLHLFNVLILLIWKITFFFLRLNDNGHRYPLFVQGIRWEEVKLIQNSYVMDSKV